MLLFFLEGGGKRLVIFSWGSGRRECYIHSTNREREEEKKRRYLSFFPRGVDFSDSIGGKKGPGSLLIEIKRKKEGPPPREKKKTRIRIPLYIYPGRRPFFR